MATILRQKEREYEETPNRIDDFRIFTAISEVKNVTAPQNLNFDFRRLDPDHYSSTYHFHRYGEEFFFITAGSATLRTPEGLEIVGCGDLIFFETGESGAHQLYNHTSEPCFYLDVRTFIGYDVCEYPDSDKILLIPTFEIFKRNSGISYFDGEENIRNIWKDLKRK